MSQGQGGGRPKTKIDWKQLESLCQFKTALEDCSEITGINAKTIERAIKREYNMTFAQYRYRKMAKTRQNLLRKQYEVAMSGDKTLLIWLGKNMLDQTDKQEFDTSDDVKKVLKLAYNLED